MKKLLLVCMFVVSLTLLVACNKTNIDDIIITPNELVENTTNSSEQADIPLVEVDDVQDIVDEKEEAKNTISLKSIDEFSLVVDDPLITKPNYGPDEEFEMNMLLSATKFPDLDHITISFTPLCGESSIIRLVIAGSLIAEEAFACNKNHDVVVSKSVLVEGYNTILFQSKVKEDFYLDDMEITFHYVSRDDEVYPGDNFFFKKSDDVDSSTLQKLGDLTLQNVVTKTFRLKEQNLLEPLYLEFDISSEGSDLLLFLNGESISYDVKRGKVSVLLPKKLLVEGVNELSFVAQTK